MGCRLLFYYVQTMNSPAAIEASFADYRTVKSRGVLQLIMEVPIERQAMVFEALGYPMPHEGIWCGLARLDPLARAERPSEETGSSPPASRDNPQPPGGAHTKDYAKSLAAKERYAALDKGEQAVVRACLLAKDKAFQQWALGPVAPYAEAEAAGAIRHWCGVASRNDIADDPLALAEFVKLEAEFAAATGRLPEIRG